MREKEYKMSFQDNKRIAKNTVLLYARMIIVLIISFYTSRVVLNALGVTDFGIYNVVGGIVAMFSIISSAMTSAISRYITFALGACTDDHQTNVFSTSLIVLFGIAATIVVLAEVIGVWFLNTHMQIPENRIIAANWVLQFSLLAFLLNLICVPYSASIVAHEDMKSFAIISIVEVVLKLAIVFILMCCEYDKLIVYSVLLLVPAIAVFFIYKIYCEKHYKECRFTLRLKKDLLIEIAGFAGWSFIGNAAGVLRNQGVNILLNIYFGPVVNAANGIANQVNSAISGFYGNFMMAVNPQIIKLYSKEQLEDSYNLVMNSARISFMLMLLIAAPIIAGAPLFLKIWLNIVPDNTVIFVRLTLLLSLIECVSLPLATLNQATGKIKSYQIVVGGIHLINFPVSWLFLSLGFSPEIVYLVAVALAALGLFARLVILKCTIGVSIILFVKNVVVRSTITFSLVSFAYYFIQVYISNPLVCSLVTLIISACVILLFGLKDSERKSVFNRILLYIK